MPKTRRTIKPSYRTGTLSRARAAEVVREVMEKQKAEAAKKDDQTPKK